MSQELMQYIPTLWFFVKLWWGASVLLGLLTIDERIKRLEYYSRRDDV